ncbi:hypothetical protein [Microcoleus sp. OTE_8_concoct_300]|uniref:hypothetical protein n=1 Tax=Microcoleus sp. OTE_8_concoct_300 TaxID=2964710 RepID=UPI00403EFCCA
MNHLRRSTGNPLLLIHRLAASWRSGNPILNELAAQRGVGELEYEYEESPCNAPSVNQPIFLKTAIKKENRILSVSNLVVCSSMIMNPPPGDSQSVKSERLKMHLHAIGFPTSFEC